MIDFPSGDVTQFLRSADIRLAGVRFSARRFSGSFIHECAELDHALFYFVRKGSAWFQAGSAPPVCVSTGHSIGVERGFHRWCDASHIHPADQRGSRPPSDAAIRTSTDVELFISSVDRSAAVLQRLPDGVIHIPAGAAPHAELIALAVGAIVGLMAQPSSQEGVMRRFAEIIMLQLVDFARLRGAADENSIAFAAHDEFLLRAMTAFFAAPESPWSVAGLAEAAGLSRAAFAHRFRAGFAKSPMAMINRLRLQLARDQLEHSAASITAIAEGVGFRSVPGFVRAFAKAFGQTPGAWRKAIREQA